MHLLLACKSLQGSETGQVPGCSAWKVLLSRRKGWQRAWQPGASVSQLTLQVTLHRISNLNNLQAGKAPLCCSWKTQHRSVSLHRRSRKYLQRSAQVNVSKMAHPNKTTNTQMCSGIGSDVSQSLDIYVHSVKSKRKCFIIQDIERSFENC